MSETRLSTKRLLELLDLFERAHQPLSDIDGQPLRGIPGWDLGRSTSLSPGERETWLERVGYAGGFPAPCGDELVPVDLEEDEDPERYWYRCPETFRRKYVAAADAAVYSVRSAALLDVIADLLTIPQALRRGLESPPIDGVLWKLGQKRIGQIQTDVWLVRGLATSFENVYRHFEARTLPERGLILSTGATLSHLMRPIRDYRLIPVKDILTEDALSPAINEDLLHRLLVGAPHETPAAQHPVQFDETEGRLTIATRDIPPWVIKGRLQAAVVRHLVTQLHHGQQWVPAHEILAKVYGAGSVRRSKRISELFKGNARWQDYIEQDGNGQYGIKLE